MKTARQGGLHTGGQGAGAMGTASDPPVHSGNISPLGDGEHCCLPSTYSQHLFGHYLF
jgi:hypothetical protein